MARRILKQRQQPQPDDGRIRITVYEAAPAEILVNGVVYIPVTDPRVQKGPAQ